MPNPQKLSPEDQDALVAQYNAGAPVKELVETFGVSASTVRNTVLRTGGTLRPVGRPAKVDA